MDAAPHDRIGLDAPLFGCFGLFAVIAATLAASGFAIVRWVLT